MAVFIDAIFSPTRREDSVRREAYYTTNWIERLNRDYKRVLKMRGAMPSQQAVLFLLGEVARSKTETTYSKKLPYIGEWLEKEGSK